jgi:hypothetical protein
MWNLNKSWIYIVHYLFLSFVLLAIIPIVASHGLKSVISYLIYLLYLVGWAYYIIVWIYVWIFLILNKQIFKITKSINISLTFTSLILTLLGGLIYYGSLYDYYQNRRIPLGAPEDYFNHISAYKEELFILVQLLLAAIITSGLFLRYGSYKTKGEN